MAAEVVYGIVDVKGRRVFSGQIQYQVEWRRQQLRSEVAVELSVEWVTRECYSDGGENGEWAVGFCGRWLTEAAVLEMFDTLDSEAG